MADGSINWLSNQSLEQSDVAQLIDAARTGANVPGLQFADVTGIVAFKIPDGTAVSWPLILGDDLILVQPDGSLMVLGGAMTQNLVLFVDGFRIPVTRYDELALHEENWSSLSDVEQVNVISIESNQPQIKTSSSAGEEVLVSVPDPLVGLAISPLLPPTEYKFSDFERREVVGSSDGGVGPPDVGFEIEGEAVLAETDAVLSFRPSDYIDIVAGGFDDGERIAKVTIEISQLPTGTTASSGTFTNSAGLLTYKFSGTLSEFECLSISFPKDFSTENRNDGPGSSDISGDILVKVSADSNFGKGTSTEFPVTIGVEEDLSFSGPGTLIKSETDDSIEFRLADAVSPRSLDTDASEIVDSVSLTLSGLPENSEVSFDNGASFALQAFGQDLVYRGTLAGYEQIVVKLPADFSTTNPESQISGVVSATTDEGGSKSTDISIVITETPDIEISAPTSIFAEEDDGQPNSDQGVAVDLQLNIVIGDIDDSETEDPNSPFAAFVDIKFLGLPADADVNDSTAFDASRGLWRGTVEQANNLELLLPGDYSGKIGSEITVTTPEGSKTVDQLITITPTKDINISGEVIVNETDDVLAVVLADFVQINDTDPDETFTDLTVTINGLPQFTTVNAGILQQDPTDATLLQYVYDIKTDNSGIALRDITLNLPKDFSTDSRIDAVAGNLKVTIEVKTDQGQEVKDDIIFQVKFEGDVEIDDNGLDAVPDETDDITPVKPSDLLEPIVTDIDFSEELETLKLTVEGLPGDFVIDQNSITGLPSDTSLFSLTDDPNDGSKVFTLTLNSGPQNIETIYDAIQLNLPKDFSTANRSDLSTDISGPTSRPLNLILEVSTDENGSALLSREVDIDFEADIFLNAKSTIEVDEDAGSGGIGVTADLEIDIRIDDIDGSETADPSDSRFAAQVNINFGILPAGTLAVDSQGSNIGSLVSLNGKTQWTGTVQQANDLRLVLPENYSGTTLSIIEVITPEGSESLIQTLIVKPTPDIDISGSIISQETDDFLVLQLSDFISIVVTDPSEQILDLTFVLPGLPEGTTSNAGSFSSPVSGIVEYSYTFPSVAESTPPQAVTLTLPKDYSTTSPSQTLEGRLTVTSTGGTEGPVPIPFLIDFETDIKIEDQVLDLSETDAVTRFKPSDSILPEGDDDDGSERIDQVAVVFDRLPASTRVSYDDGASFVSASPTLAFLGTLEEYKKLVIELPVDYSTENPASLLKATITAVSNESGPSKSAELTVKVAAEGDLVVNNIGSIALSENDAPGDFDEDSTPQNPLIFKPSDVASAVASGTFPTLADDDGSESIAEVQLSFLTNLPSGAQYALGGQFIDVPANGALPILNGNEYNLLEIRLPDDFSTESPAQPGAILAEVTFRTDEAILASETDLGPTDGIETVQFSIIVNDEADVEIQVADISVFEDVINIDPSVDEIPLNIKANLTDSDSSESFQGSSIEFEGLPVNGPTKLNDGTILNGPSDVWVGNSTIAEGLAITEFPEHFSGTIRVTPTFITNEGDPTGTSDSFLLKVFPVAEPEIILSVDSNESQVTEDPSETYSVKEDTSFLLLIDTNTPDQDGSEQLVRVIIDNIPLGWLPNGTIPSSLIELGSSDVRIAKLSGTQLTIELNQGIQSFSGGIRVTPNSNDDRDIDTIVGDDLLGTVTSQDFASGLSLSTEFASDDTDVNIDAVVDNLTIVPSDQLIIDESTTETKIDLIDFISFDDADGSEFVTELKLDIFVTTESTINPGDGLNLGTVISGNENYINIVRVSDSTTNNTSSFIITQTADATDSQFISALTDLHVSIPGYFSGILSNAATISWQETRTTDQEYDLSDLDNKRTEQFDFELRIQPVAEAALDLRVFVRNDDLYEFDTADGSPTEIIGSAKVPGDDDTQQSVTIDEILTIQESTLDGSGQPGRIVPGNFNDQVEVYFGLSASTPDKDGSEQLDTLVIENIPTDWVPQDWPQPNPAGEVSIPTDKWDSFLRASSGGNDPIPISERDKIDEISFNNDTGIVTLLFKDGTSEFDGSIVLTPTPYEDWDPSQVAPFGVAQGIQGTGGQLDINDNPIGSFPVGLSKGKFHGEDITVRIDTRDNYTASSSTEVTEFAEITADIDVAPITNFAYLVSETIGRENIVDAAGGILEFSARLELNDRDISEAVKTVVFKSVPRGISLYVDPSPQNNIDDPKVPALISALNTDGTADWTLSEKTWENFEFRGIPENFAGSFPIEIDVVTEEFDGGQTRLTKTSIDVVIEPVADGGNPSGYGEGNEDTAFEVNLFRRIIDNANNSFVPPDISTESVSRVQLNTPDFPLDSFDRAYLLFIGAPQKNSSFDVNDPNNPSGYDNVINPSDWIDWADATDLWILPGQDSNENIKFEVKFEYVEDIAPALYAPEAPPAFTKIVSVGEVTIEVLGVADTPNGTAQNEDPATTLGGIPIGDVDDYYRPTADDPVGLNQSINGATGTPIQNYNRLYGYAGDSTSAFRLNKRLTDDALKLDLSTATQAQLDSIQILEDATQLSGKMTERKVTYPNGALDFDGSETLYYLITGIPTGTGFLGVTPTNTDGNYVLVTDVQLANLTFIPKQVSEVTYYDLKFWTVVVEDDFDAAAYSDAVATITDPGSTLPDLIDAIRVIASQPGGALVEEDFSIVVLPDSVGPGPSPCPAEEVKVPTLILEGSGKEDDVITLELKLVPDDQYSDILDLVNNLPFGIDGNIGVNVSLPAGSQLSSDPPGAVIIDPLTGNYVIDLAKFLSTTPSGTATASGKIFFTPPEQESSPVNPFPEGETFGGDDPYDNLGSTFELNTILNNISCGTTSELTGGINIFIEPVVDPPTITVDLQSLVPSAEFPVPEDGPIKLEIDVTSPDPGERVAPGTGVTIKINGSHIGGTRSDVSETLGLLVSGLYQGGSINADGVYVGGTIIDDARLSIDLNSGDYVYSLDYSEINDLVIVPKNHVDGELIVRVTASVQDINNAIRAGAGTAKIDIDAVADSILINIEEDLGQDPESGADLVTIDDGGTPNDANDDIVEIYAVEDQKIFVAQFAKAAVPDIDGSEALSITFEVTDDTEVGTDTLLPSLVNNGDGTYTVALNESGQVWLRLKEEHGRTSGDGVPDAVEFNATFITYETSNADETETDVTFRFRVRPDADKPTIEEATIQPTDGVEDQITPYEVTLIGTTPDPHEILDFEIRGVPNGGTIKVGTTDVPVNSGIAVISGVLDPTASGDPTFLPNDTVTFTLPENFAGSVELQVVAITTDDTPGPWELDGYVDRQESDVAILQLEIVVAPDLTFDLKNDAVVIDETDAPINYAPTTDIDIDLTDIDSSETIEIIYELDNVPDGTSYTIGSTTTPVSAGQLSITLTSVADFNDLMISFPADFATDSGAINGTVTATTNEGGTANGNFTITVNGTSDLDVTITPSSAPETGVAVVIPLGIDASINDNTPTAYEFLETVEIAFDAPLPAGTIVSAGTISPDGSSLLLERNGAAPATFVATVAALALTVPPGFAGDIVADITVTSTHDTQVFADQTYSINGAPDIVAPPLDIVSTTTTTVLTFAELTATATDPDTPLIVENVSSDDPAISSIVVDQGAQTVTIDVAAGYDAISVLTYDIVDSGVGPARTTTTANLDIDTLQMVSIGQQVGADGITREVMSDVAGTVGRTDFAKGTADADLVTHTGAPDSYTDIAGFRMEGGNDLVDLSAASNGFDVDLGTGDDIAIGSSGDDILTGGIGADQLTGGAGFDTLQGGLGDDTFILDALPSVTDVITDYGTGADQIDITALVNGVATVTDAEADYNPLTGALDVLGAQAYLIQGLPPSVEVIFENASGVAEVATLT